MSFPLDGITLPGLREALETTFIGIDEEGDPITPEGKVTTGSFLEFLSNQEVEYEDEHMRVLAGSGYSLQDACRALIDEVFFLREKLGMDLIDLKLDSL